MGVGANGMIGRRGAMVLLAVVGLVLLLAASPAAALAGEGSLDQSFGEAGWAAAPPGVLQGYGDGVEIGVGPDGSADLADDGTSVVRFTAAGARDYGFGEGGVLDFRTDPAAEGAAARRLSISSIAVDGDGRLLAFGAETDSRHTFSPELVSGGELPSSRVAVLRYDPEGKLDPSFGGGGIVTGAGLGSNSGLPPFEAIDGTVDSRNRPVFLAGAGSVVNSCIGHSGVDYAPRGVVRLAEDGEPDRGFGEDGIARLKGAETSFALGIDAADRPVAEIGPFGGARTVCKPIRNLVRLGADGSRLAGFGKAGTVRLREQGLALVEPSGALLVEHFHRRLLELARIPTTGGRDKRFGKGGLAKVVLPAGAGFGVEPVAVDSAGRILLVGSLGKAHSVLVVGRLLPDGSLDPSFGEGGWLAAPVRGSFKVRSTAAALDPQGRLLVAAAGTGSPEASGNGYVLARFLLGPSA